jgi:DNA gyrase subunit A
MSSADPLDIGRVEPRELEEEMRTSFLDYAMSVIVARALPDVRDGLKPVHRRVLFAMHEAGLQPNRPRVKCSAVIGDVMKSFHPHGDQSIYDTLVRMAQKFSLRYPLVDPQGNFGNIDGYSAAAHRYTEARLSAIATELLRDIGSDTVDFEPNYDGSRTQPTVLPARFPNLLVNGSSGIAVGMATNMPPHHLGEVVDAIVAMIDDPAIDVAGLTQHVRGPDFPTGAFIVGREGIRESYRSGRGRVIMRARAHIEELRGGKNAVIVTELPYGVRKGGDEGVIRKIAELVKDNVLTEISGIKDLSDKSGMRIQIELKREAVPQVVLNKLYKRTPLQSTFGYNAVALVDGVPRTLSLLELVRHYLDHQRDVVTRRLKFDLRNAVRRAHVLEGYLIALDNLDAVIALIRAADSTDAARTGLMEKFSLSEIQAQAILDMRLARLTGLARKEIEAEFADLQERISEIRLILSDESRIDAVIREELLEIKQIYGRNDERRTEIVAGEDSLEIEDMIAEEDMVIAITRSGYIKRLPVTTYREQRRGGIGVMGMDMKDEDYIEHLFVASTHDFILFFTSVGKVYRLKVHELPLGSRQSKGRAIVNLLPFRQDELVRAVIATRNYEEAKYLVFATKKGIVKKTPFLDYNTPLKADGIIALKMREDDELVGVRLSTGDDDILMVSRGGQAIRFHEKDARSMGRPASGVQGMRLRGDDEVIEVDIANDDAELLVVTVNGWGKRTRVSEYPVKGRGGLGVQTAKLVEGKGKLAGARIVREGYQVMLISDGGTVIKMAADDIKRSGRATQGVIVMRLREGEIVSGLAPVVGSDEDDDVSLEDAAEVGAGLVADGAQLQPVEDDADLDPDAELTDEEAEPDADEDDDADLDDDEDAEDDT